MDAVVETAIKNPHDQENFAKWIGIDPATLVEDAPPEAEAEDAADSVVDDTPLDAADDAAPEAEPAEPDASDAEPDPEPVKLPFEAKANDAAVDTSLLASMEITLKADGKEVTLPLTDVVRRAQSEPAAQRQARQEAEARQRAEQLVQQVQEELSQVRKLAQDMARDPNFYATVAAQLEQYDAPEARAERAERQLAAERERQQQERQQAEFTQRVQQFAAEVVAPALDTVLGQAPLVKQEELLGKFFTDTASMTVNGVIPPERHQDLAHYLRTEFATYAASRQAEEAAREQRIRAEARKTQLERQRMKSQTASATKPVGTAAAVPRDGTPQVKPRTAKEAEQNALSALLGGLS